MKVKVNNQIVTISGNLTEEQLKGLFPGGYEIVQAVPKNSLTSDAKREALGIYQDIWDEEFVPAIEAMQKATNAVNELLKKYAIDVACGCYIGNKPVKKLDK